jgi:hypothetical protein
VAAEAHHAPNRRCQQRVECPQACNSNAPGTSGKPNGTDTGGPASTPAIRTTLSDRTDHPAARSAN